MPSIMELLFGSSYDPEQICHKLELLADDPASKKTVEKCLQRLKRGISGEDASLFIGALSQPHRLEALIRVVYNQDGEVKRMASDIFTLVIQRSELARRAINKRLIDLMISGYTTRHDLAVYCGQIIRELFHYQELSVCLTQPFFFIILLKSMGSDSFDAASDAFETMSVLVFL